MGQPTLKIHDCGDLKGTVVAFGGPSSNLHAVNALAEVTRELTRDNVICTGDVMAYCADPGATWTRTSEIAGTIVAGNCEKQLGTLDEGCGCGFEAGSTCDLASRAWYAHAATEAGPFRQAMLSCPDIATFTLNGQRVAVIHGGVQEIARFIWPTSTQDVFRQEIRAINAACGAVDMVISGHCGIAFQRQIDDVLWINAGSIGLPPHDGRPQTRYLRLDGQGAVLERLSYDAEAAARAMRDAGLVQGYDICLETGYWPSEDVLPAQLRRAA